MEPGTGAPSVARRGPGTVAGIAAFVLAALSALATPLMGLPDEPAHAVHAVAVVHGQVAGEDEVRTTPEDGWTRTETVVEVPAAYAELPLLPTCFVFLPSVPARCAPPPASEAGTMTTSSSTVGTYDPVWYAAVGWPARVLPPTVALYAMRILSAITFGALAAVAAVGLARAGGRRWAWVGLALALPPIAVHVAGGINPSGTEIAAAVALWATSAALLTGARAAADVARWVAAGVVLAVTRPLGPVLALAIPVGTWLVLGRRDGASGWRGIVPTWAPVTVVVVAIAGMAWNVWRGTLSAFSGIPEEGLGTLGVVRRSLGLVPERLDQMVGVLGWADVVLPRWLVVGWYAVLAALLVAVVRRVDTRALVSLVAIGLATLALPVLADLRSADEIGLVWQGRYTLPVAAGLPVLGGLLVDRGGPGATDAGRWWSAAALAALGIGHVVALWAVLRRFRVGVDGSALSVLGTRGAALAVPGWVILACALSVVLVVAVVQTMDRGRHAGEAAERR